MMKTVLFLAGLVAFVAAGTVPTHVEFKTVDQEFIHRQKQVLALLKHNAQPDTTHEFYKDAKFYDIEANIENYTNKKAVEEFLLYSKNRMLPQGLIFSVFNEKMREEAIALYHLFFYAKDFETFFKTAAWARVWMNEGMFLYSFSIAVMHRPDTKGIVLPAPYEIYPFYFVNSDVINKLYRIKMQEGLVNPEVASYYGITFEENVYTVYANYSGFSVYDNEEQKLSYFTEDIGLNTYYYYFHTSAPFWMNGAEYGVLKERRGEYYFFFYRQLLARYYMERLTNGLGEIPEFSWRWPVKTGYTPNLVAHNFYPFVTRNNYYTLQTPENVQELEFLESYENQFLGFLEQGFFNAYNHEVDMKHPKAVNFVGNYWQSSKDLYEKVGNRDYQQYYEIIARVLLGASAEHTRDYYSAPVVLEQFQTALRDPVFYQFYKRIMYYFLQYKQYLEPYTRDELHFTGVKVNDVKVSELVTFFDFYTFSADNVVQYNQEELKNQQYHYQIRQARVNHKPFTVDIEVKSEVATDAVVKIFLAPKYNDQGHELSLEENWENFVELDWFKYKLAQGKTNIVRQSQDFTFFKDDSVTYSHLLKMVEEGKVPVDMSENFFRFPKRLMLPRGTKGGFPFQFFVIVYPYEAVGPEYNEYKQFIVDAKPFGFPFDRPVNELYFYQPNMHFEDVYIHHEGEQNVFKYTYHGLEHFHNIVLKH